MASGMSPICFFFALASVVRSDRIYDAMYTDIETSPCVRLLTHNGEIGCSTDGRVVGTLRYLDESTLDSIKKDPPNYKLALVVPQSMWNLSTVLTLSESLDLAGILILDGDILPSGYSPTEKSPQSYVARSRGEVLYNWNIYGSEDTPVTLKRFNFAIVSVREEAANVEERAKQNEDFINKNGFPPFVAEFNYPMYATKNSIDCLSDATCLPVGGFSVWATTKPLNESAADSTPVVLATAMLDSSAFFHSQAHGANSYQSGVVTLLAAVTALTKFNVTVNQCRNATELDKHIMVAFLQGEQFNYVGSRRMATDLFHGLDCKEMSSKYSNLCLNPYKPSTLFTRLNLTDITDIIEVGQVGIVENNTLYLHNKKPQSLGRVLDVDPTERLINLTQTAAETTPFTVTTPSPSLPSLPPSSILSFLEILPSQFGVGSISINGHNTTFNNPYYLSRFDRNLTASQRDKMCQASRLVARTLYAAAGGGTEEECLEALDLAVDCDVVTALFECLVVDFDCDLVQGLVGDVEEGPVSHYSGVYYLVDTHRIQGVSRFIKLYLEDLLYNTNGYGSAYHDAVDPVLEFDVDKDKWKLKDGEVWSTNTSLLPSQLFTESNWAYDIGTRMYRREDPETRLIMLVLGFLVTLIAGVAGWFAKPYIVQNFKT